MSVSLPSVRLIEIQLLAYALLLRQPIKNYEVMSFLARPPFVLMVMSNFASSVMAFRDTFECLSFSQLNYFFPFTYLF